MACETFTDLALNYRVYNPNPLELSLIEPLKAKCYPDTCQYGYSEIVQRS